MGASGHPAEHPGSPLIIGDGAGSQPVGSGRMWRALQDSRWGCLKSALKLGSGLDRSTGMRVSRRKVV